MIGSALPPCFSAISPTFSDSDAPECRSLKRIEIRALAAAQGLQAGLYRVRLLDRSAAFDRDLAGRTDLSVQGADDEYAHEPNFSYST